MNQPMGQIIASYKRLERMQAPETGSTHLEAGVGSRGRGAVQEEEWGLGVGVEPMGRGVV